MEKKKKVSETKKKPQTTKTTKTTKTTETVKKVQSKKTAQKKKKKKGFTLIELLAVIIILGILMIIAIPAVTSYITSSRKSAYVNTAKEIVGGARNVVNEGKLGMYDTNTTYYIESGLIKTENSSKSPYGDFVNAYVIVTYDGTGYTYYWTSVDDAGQGVRNIVKYDLLDEDDIESDIVPGDIAPNVGIGSRENIVIIRKDGTQVIGNREYSVSEEGGARAGGSSGGQGGSSLPANIVCKRAERLFVSINCIDYADDEDYLSRNPSCYIGNKNVTEGTLNFGDPFDCDVNQDGVFSEENERFYYFSECDANSYLNCATLIYSYNVKNGSIVSSYNSGKTTFSNAVNNLPTTSQWKHPSLIRSSSRVLYGYHGFPSEESLNYYNRPARLLSGVEYESYVSEANGNDEFLADHLEEGEGYWIEYLDDETTYEPRSTGYIVKFDGYSSYATMDFSTDSSDEYGVRPVINVSLDDILY